MARDKKYIVGYNLIEEKVYVYKDANEASRECQIWKVVESETAAEAKSQFMEMIQDTLDNINE